MAQLKYCIDVKSSPQGHYRAFVLDKGNRVHYRSDGFKKEYDAKRDAEIWIKWSREVPKGEANSIYYVVAVPHDWVGSAQMKTHPYIGLRVKIGVSKHPEKRVRALQTGTSDKLILHALEPGERELERKRHKEFSDHQRIGEWFICSKALANHILRTWYKYKILPPGHQQNVMVLLERIKLFESLYEKFPKGFDMVNPPLDVPWHGTVFLDLTHLEDENESGE